jgi:tRNA(fMet)-specific endonuclease VapC
VRIYILDTDHVSMFQQNHPLVVQKINSISDDKIAVTVITVQEQMKGWLNVINRYGNNDQLVWAYAGLSEAIRFFNSIQLFDFDQLAYDTYQSLRIQKIRIGTQDLRIAAITISLDGIMVTRNRKDFSKVPNLLIEDWSI